MSYRYKILSPLEERQREKNEKSRLEMDLAYVASEVASLKLRFKIPVIRFITECDHGDVVMNRSVDGYCSNSSQIFLKTGLPLVRMINVVIHETRHAWQWGQPLWAGRNDDHCEKDATLFIFEFWATRRIETEDDKLLPQLCELGLPLAMDAGAEEAAYFYVEELKATGHPAAARLDKQYVEWCRKRERTESPLSPRNLSAPSAAARAARDHYYNNVLPTRAQPFVRPHLAAFRIEYSIGGIPR